MFILLFSLYLHESRSLTSFVLLFDMNILPQSKRCAATPTLTAASRRKDCVAIVETTRKRKFVKPEMISQPNCRKAHLHVIQLKLISVTAEPVAGVQLLLCAHDVHPAVSSLSTRLCSNKLDH